MDASIIIIGDEILLGQVVDTNSSEIARTICRDGWNTVQTIVVGDNEDDIRSAIEQSLDASDLVICTGGLGPTKDDITKHVLMSIFGGEEVWRDDVLENVKRVFAARGLTLNELTRRQALVPTSCQVIQNRLGTAPGMLFRKGAKALISMPGVPFEAVDMLHNGAMPAIRELFMPDVERRHRTLIVSGITESDLAEKLATWEESLPGCLHLAYLPSPGLIRLRLDGVCDTKLNVACEFDAVFDRALHELTALTGEYLINDGDAAVAEILINKLRASGLTVATAESCTGGNIAHAITLVPGCSDVMKGGVVSYANEVKIRLLGVAESDITAHGAVSREVVTSMAEGVCRATGAVCSMATSGIAGPGGATPDKPVGTVWIAVHTPRGTRAGCFHLPGSRTRVIDRATTEAMLMLIKELASASAFQ